MRRGVARGSTARGETSFGYARAGGTVDMAKTRMRYIGSGLASTHEVEAEKVRIEILSMKTFRAALGTKVVASLARAMFAADRLTSMHALAAMNLRSRGGEMMKKRNHMAVVSVAWGYLHEFARALDELEGDGVRDLLDDPAPWDAIVKVRQLWFGTGRDPLAKTLRNALAFHPGSREPMIKAVRYWPKTRVAVVVEGTGDKQRNMTWPFGLDLVLRSEKVKMSKLRKFLKSVMTHEFEIEDMLYDLILALAKSNEGKRRK
jgi:hypothetical protein